MSSLRNSAKDSCIRGLPPAVTPAAINLTFKINHISFIAGNNLTKKIICISTSVSGADTDGKILTEIQLTVTL